MHIPAIVFIYRAPLTLVDKKNRIALKNERGSGAFGNFVFLDNNK